MQYPDYTLRKRSEPHSPCLLTIEHSRSELQELCECAIEVGQQAAEVVHDIYQSSADLGVELKADQTPVTKADKAADQLIISQLRKYTRLPIVTEEHPLDISERRDRPSLWMVDPLDGTQNFITRDGQFAVLIALLHHNVPLVGVVCVPTTGESYAAFHQGGAQHISAQGKVRTVKHSLLDRELLAVLSNAPSAEGREREERFCQNNAIAPEHISRVSSAFKLARLAQGDFDLTVRFDRLGEWDIAAADCLLAESGCVVTDVCTGQAIAYNARASLHLPGYAALRSDFELVQG